MRKFRITSTILAIVLGFVLAYGIFSMQENPGQFFADIAQTINPEAYAEDVQYLVDTGFLSIYAKKSVIWNVVLRVQYDHTLVSLDTSNIQVPVNTSLYADQEGVLEIRFVRDNPSSDPLVVLPFVADEAFVLVSDAYIDNDGAQRSLSIQRL